MSEKNQIEESVDTTEQATLQTQTPKAKTSILLKVFVFIALMIAIAASAGGVYLWQQFQKMQQQTQTQFNNFDSSIATKVNSAQVNDLLSQSTSAIETDLSTINQQIQQATTERKQLNSSALKLFELYGRDKNGWQLAEVEYLLRIAQHRLVIEQDFEGAEKTLKAADEKLAEIADPGLLAVRVAISDERTELQTHSRPDLVGMVLSLTRLIHQAPYLKIVSLNSQKQLSKQPTTDDKAGSEPLTLDNWKQQLNNFVTGLVKVNDLKPTDKQQSVNAKDVLKVIEEDLKLAKWAVLERNQKQFKILMNKISESFKPYYDSSSVLHVQFAQHLKELTKMEINPQLPDISQSLLLLKREMIKQQHVLSDAVKSVEVKQAISTLENTSKPSKTQGDDTHE